TRPETGKASDTCLLLHLVFLKEFLDAPLGVHDLLLARVERMALRTYLDADIIAGGAGLERIATLADDTRRLVFRMDSLLHWLLAFTTFSTIIYETRFLFKPKPQENRLERVDFGVPCATLRPTLTVLSEDLRIMSSVSAETPGFLIGRNATLVCLGDSITEAH